MKFKVQRSRDRQGPWIILDPNGLFHQGGFLLKMDAKAECRKLNQSYSESLKGVI